MARFPLDVSIVCVALLFAQVIQVHSARLLLQDSVYSFQAKTEEVVSVEEPGTYDYTKTQSEDSFAADDHNVVSDLPDADSLAEFQTLDQQEPSEDHIQPPEQNQESDFVSYSSVDEDKSYVYDAQKNSSPLEFSDLSNTQISESSTQNVEFSSDSSDSDTQGFDADAVLYDQSTSNQEPQFLFETSEQFTDDSLSSETTADGFDDNVTGGAP